MGRSWENLDWINDRFARHDRGVDNRLGSEDHRAAVLRRARKRDVGLFVRLEAARHWIRLYAASPFQERRTWPHEMQVHDPRPVLKEFRDWFKKTRVQFAKATISDVRAILNAVEAQAIEHASEERMNSLANAMAQWFKLKQDEVAAREAFDRDMPKLRGRHPPEWREELDRILEVQNALAAALAPLREHERMTASDHPVFCLIHGYLANRISVRVAQERGSEQLTVDALKYARDGLANFRQAVNAGDWDDMSALQHTLIFRVFAAEEPKRLWLARLCRDFVPWTWSDKLGAAGLAIALVAMTLATAGAGSTLLVTLGAIEVGVDAWALDALYDEQKRAQQLNWMEPWDSALRVARPVEDLELMLAGASLLLSFLFFAKDVKKLLPEIRLAVGDTVDQVRRKLGKPARSHAAEGLSSTGRKSVPGTGAKDGPSPRDEPDAAKASEPEASGRVEGDLDVESARVGGSESLPRVSGAEDPGVGKKEAQLGAEESKARATGRPDTEVPDAESRLVHQEDPDFSVGDVIIFNAKRARDRAAGRVLAREDELRKVENALEKIKSDIRDLDARKRTVLAEKQKKIKKRDRAKKKSAERAAAEKERKNLQARAKELRKEIAVLKKEMKQPAASVKKARQNLTQAKAQRSTETQKLVDLGLEGGTVKGKRHEADSLGRPGWTNLNKAGETDQQIWDWYVKKGKWIISDAFSEQKELSHLLTKFGEAMGMPVTDGKLGDAIAQLAENFGETAGITKSTTLEDIISRLGFQINEEQYEAFLAYLWKTAEVGKGPKPNWGLLGIEPLVEYAERRGLDVQREITRRIFTRKRPPPEF